MKPYNSSFFRIYCILGGLCSCLWLITITDRLQGQESSSSNSEDGEVEKPLGFFFPMETNGPNVILSQTCLINRNTILPKGTILLTAFHPPHVEDADVKKEEQRIKRKEAYSKERDLTIKALSAREEALRERALTTRWNSPLPFRAMLNRIQINEVYLAYRTSDNKVNIDAVDLPEGLLLVEEGSHIEVAWVSPEKKNPEYGFHFNDRIVSINGQDVKDLPAFQRIYLSLRTNYTENKRAHVSVGVIPAGEKEIVYVTLKAPPTLSGSVLDLP